MIMESVKFNVFHMMNDSRETPTNSTVQGHVAYVLCVIEALLLLHVHLSLLSSFSVMVSIIQHDID